MYYQLCWLYRCWSETKATVRFVVHQFRNFMHISEFQTHILKQPITIEQNIFFQISVLTDEKLTYRND